MKAIYKLLLTLDATSLMILVYMIKCECWIPGLGSWSIILYLLFLIVYTWLCILLSVVLKDDNIKTEIREITIVTNGYVTAYLGCFFVALSITEQKWLLFGIVFAMINVLIYNSQTIYFNPLLCLFGYNFYEVHTKKGTRVYVISKEKNIKGTSGLVFSKLKKLNEFTYIDKEKRNGLFIGKGKGQKKSV